ncbi:UDP-N-acetylmuramoyl-tripeptide--D-alanyl-D-alanine ligase [Xenococcus sp. PCC 7305]|uniref:UDP-N-acetylmuramoyl-tripeptide--D-alanyl-D- alanine ligase n=1 Tax=Xenococcus sp. PCC 7305 TaxID=102125 RepID=UPI0002ABEE27|nr:UDP-N-acetylmuramoyl-tripeptide--D-alanyl-D-alanine ligase [Xenococcus sp. PCC 7305]ELS02537.1 UDP-N-acetylmuramoyl-tripeptide--D-alanyl-D-alanine ligase [Xenococcus sp. PCC 7305]
MTKNIPLGELGEILGDNLLQTVANGLTTFAIAASTDTRNFPPGGIFLALEGEQFDGHDFAAMAIEQGATALILSRQLSLTSDVPQFIVADTLTAYQQIACWWRDRFNIPIIGVTGSVGKTSTKELIAAVLGTQGKVLKTQANYNNEIGVPKTLLEITPEHDYAVIEMAMRGLGEIALLTDIAKPTIGVITNVGTAHIGRLGSKEAIAQAKCELLARMSPQSTAILNYDNPLLIETAAQVWQGKTITYGLTGGDLQGDLSAPDMLSLANKKFPLPLPGSHNASNYLAAIAVAQILEIDTACLTAGLTVQLPKGRARRYQLSNDILLLDETYNAGFESMQAALRMLKATPGQRHLAVLGTMKELGSYSAALHQQVGVTVQELGIDRLLVLADEPETETMIAGAEGVISECFRDRALLGDRLRDIMASGDRILFKASNSVGLNQVVEELRQNR